jgi:hypothetical protein
MNRLFLLAVGLLAAPSAYATPYAYRVIAGVSWVSDSEGLLGGTVSVGDALYLDYIYDSGVSGAIQAGQGVYAFATRPYGATVTVGPWVMGSDPANVGLRLEYSDNFVQYQDTFVLHSFPNVATGPTALDVDTISLELSDPTMTALSGPSLVPIDLAAWSTGTGVDVWGYAGPHYWELFATPSDIRAMPFLTVSSGVGAPATFTGTGYSGGHTVALLTSRGVGTVSVPWGPCVGSQTGLSAPTLRRMFAANRDGEFTVHEPIAPAMSGQLVVAFDMTTCTASPAVRIP